MVDALSYPYSIIQIIRDFIKLGRLDIGFLIDNMNLSSKGTINIILLGASQRTEERIALNSKYYDEIYYYLLAEITSFMNKTSNTTNSNKKELSSILKQFKLNIVFTGEEVQSNSGFLYSSNINYSYFPLKTEQFLKENMFDFSKDNSILIGMNCGFGAGYQKLTFSWIKDLQLVLKLKYLVGFTFTNDYEDFKGEKLIMDYLCANIIEVNMENPFKSMSIYQSSDDKDHDNKSSEGEGKKNWSCGNYGYYLVHGGSKKNIKVDNEKIISILKENQLLK
mmetsp:Transcript_14997/g.15512  ORF Transcript_14997/g.15512 Transcript_14997/m.15512 type:complete len:279 (-) Transcript_14997:15-851(-)